MRKQIFIKSKYVPDKDNDPGVAYIGVASPGASDPSGISKSLADTLYHPIFGNIDTDFTAKNLSVEGNLYIKGEISNVLANTNIIEDALLKLNNGNNLVDSGLTIFNGTDNKARLFFRASDKRWVMGDDDVYHKIASEDWVDSHYLRKDINQTMQGKLWLNGQIVNSSARLQVNGFMRTGNIFLHTGGNTPNADRTADTISNNNGSLEWRSNTVWTALNSNKNTINWAAKSLVMPNGVSLANVESMLRVNTSHGYLNIGANNAGYCHFYTDRDKYYFNKQIKVDSGIISSFDEDLYLQRCGTTLIQGKTSGVEIKKQLFALGVDKLSSDMNAFVRLSHRQKDNADANAAVYVYGDRVDYYINKEWRCRFNSTGLKIGSNSNPTEALDVTGNGKFSGTLRISSKIMIGNDETCLYGGGHAGITASGQEYLRCAGTDNKMYMYKNTYFGGYIQNNGSFAEGFSGSGTRLDLVNGKLTVDNIVCRETFKVYEFVKDTIRIENGNKLQSAFCQFTTFNVKSATEYRLYFAKKEDNGLTIGDFIEARENGQYFKAKVSWFSDTSSYLVVITISGEPWTDMLAVRIDSIVSSRRASIYYAVDEDNSPYIDFLQGDGTGTRKAGWIKTRIGNVSGIYDDEMGQLSGVGAYLENAFVKGKIVAKSGNVGKWIIQDGLIYTSGGGKHMFIQNSETKNQHAGAKRGITIYNDNIAVPDGGIKVIQCGMLTNKDTSTTWPTTPNYGFRLLKKVTDSRYRDIFRADKDGALISVFNFDEKRIDATFSNVHMSIGEAKAWTSSVMGFQVGRDANNRIWVGSNNGKEEIQVRQDGNALFIAGGNGNKFTCFAFDKDKLYATKGSVKISIGKGYYNGNNYGLEIGQDGNNRMSIYSAYDGSEYGLYLKKDGAGKIWLKGDGSGYVASQKIKWNADGSGNICNKINWNAAGAITLDPSVKIAWGSVTGTSSVTDGISAAQNAADNAATTANNANKTAADAQSTANSVDSKVGSKLTKIDANGIYTGALTAGQVNALTCNFTKGTIANWGIHTGELQHTVSGRHLSISNKTSGTVSDNRGRRGFVMYNDDSTLQSSSNSIKAIRIGSLSDKGKLTTFTTPDNYGIQIWQGTSGAGHEVFRADKDGAFIGGWNINKDSIISNNDRTRLFADGNIELIREGSNVNRLDFTLKKGSTFYEVGSLSTSVEGIFGTGTGTRGVSININNGSNEQSNASINIVHNDNGGLPLSRIIYMNGHVAHKGHRTATGNTKEIFASVIAAYDIVRIVGTHTPYFNLNPPNSDETSADNYLSGKRLIIHNFLTNAQTATVQFNGLSFPNNTIPADSVAEFIYINKKWYRIL